MQSKLMKTKLSTQGSLAIDLFLGSAVPIVSFVLLLLGFNLAVGRLYTAEQPQQVNAASLEVISH